MRSSSFDDEPRRDPRYGASWCDELSADYPMIALRMTPSGLSTSRRESLRLAARGLVIDRRHVPHTRPSLRITFAPGEDTHPLPPHEPRRR
jgi:hypothetical protein